MSAAYSWLVMRQVGDSYCLRLLAIDSGTGFLVTVEPSTAEVTCCRSLAQLRACEKNQQEINLFRFMMEPLQQTLTAHPQPRSSEEMVFRAVECDTRDNIMNYLKRIGLSGLSLDEEVDCSSCFAMEGVSLELAGAPQKEEPQLEATKHILGLTHSHIMDISCTDDGGTHVRASWGYEHVVSIECFSRFRLQFAVSDRDTDDTVLDKGKSKAEEDIATTSPSFKRLQSANRKVRDIELRLAARYGMPSPQHEHDATADDVSQVGSGGCGSDSSRNLSTREELEARLLERYGVGIDIGNSPSVARQSSFFSPSPSNCSDFEDSDDSGSSSGSGALSFELVQSETDSCLALLLSRVALIRWQREQMIRASHSQHFSVRQFDSDAVAAAAIAVDLPAAQAQAEQSRQSRNASRTGTPTGTVLRSSRARGSRMWEIAGARGVSAISPRSAISLGRTGATAATANVGRQARSFGQATSHDRQRDVVSHAREQCPLRFLPSSIGGE